MGEKLTKSREAISRFIQSANAADEFFLVEFGDAVRFVQPFTTSPKVIQNLLRFTGSTGRSALLDAVYLAIQEMDEAKNARKALLIVSDGADNNSRYTAGEVKDLAKEADVQIYAIGICEPIGQRPQTPEELRGPDLLTGIPAETGGRYYAAESVNDLDDVADEIGVALRSQYILGFAPRNVKGDGKYHRVQVKLALPNGLGPLRASWRMGYYAPLE